MRRELGDWLRHRLRKGVGNQGTAAREVLHDCGASVMELQEQWADQRATQLSIRAHKYCFFLSHSSTTNSISIDAPSRLKKELDNVLVLQADFNSSTRVLQLARTTIEKGNTSSSVLDALASLERSHMRLVTKTEALYLSLNVHDRIPELKDVSLKFVRILLMARDLKINIHKRAVGSFFEWDKLDHAVGSKDKPLGVSSSTDLLALSKVLLGTKLHQQTQKAIAKRQPALMAAIRKYNNYCEQLSQLYNPTWVVSLPMPLPTTLIDLRNDPTLMQGIWITPSTGKVPRWLEDIDVRDGICALLKHKRCLEEQCRLSIEADNMCQWFGHELTTIQVALQQPESKFSQYQKFLLINHWQMATIISFYDSVSKRFWSYRSNGQPR